MRTPLDQVQDILGHAIEAYRLLAHWAEQKGFEGDAKIYAAYALCIESFLITLNDNIGGEPTHDVSRMVH